MPTIIISGTAQAFAENPSGESEANIADYFVDAYPMFSDEQPQVEFLKTDYEKTDLVYLQEAAAFGEPQVPFQLARLLEEGEGITKNESLAFDYYQLAAAQDHLYALTFLGICLQRSIGT